MDTGSPGVLRLLVPPLSKEMSWLLPFGFVSMVLVATGSRWQWPISKNHQALVLWGIWLITCAIFFSIAGFFHQYYLSMLAPPLAVLVGIGVSQLWHLTGTRRWNGILLLGVSAGGTVAFQIYTAERFVRIIWWFPVILVLVVVGLAILVFSAIARRQDTSFVLGFALVTAAMFLTPGIWSVLTNLAASQNQSLPSAYSGERIGPVAQRGLQINETSLNYLEAHTQGMTYLMAVPSSMQGADYVLATGRPVLYMGGFMGQDNVVTAESLALLVKDGELRYIYWNAIGRGPGTNSDISSWIASSCNPLQGFETSTQNAGAPDGIGANLSGAAVDPNNGFLPSRNGSQGDMFVSLYDCGNQ